MEKLTVKDRTTKGKFKVPNIIS